MLGRTFLAIFWLSLFLYGSPCHSLPLSTKNRWIVNERSGQRVKLHCLNWPSHMESMLAEGLDKQPLGFIASQVVKNKYNCLRFTWSTYMFTRANYGNLTVAQSFDALNLTKAKAGIAKNNPKLLPMTVLQAFDTVVDVLGAHGLMLVLDNHISKPTWCCSENDGNGFPNDESFNPDEWIKGLTTVAQRYTGKSQVIGIGLRNELRGSHQNEDDWYKYIQEAATKVHEVNSDVLIMASGLNYATNLTFLKNKSLGSNFNNKLVLEAHIYSWSSGSRDIWASQSLNNVCADKLQLLDDNVGFVNTGENPVPLFFGEFGIDQTVVTPVEDRFLSCFLSYAIGKDLDWGLWALQGDYYFRNNQTGMEEEFGILDITWSYIRNPKMQERLQLMKTIIQDPNANSFSSYIMYHPQSGLCIRTNRKNVIYPGNCKYRSHWVHNGDEAPIRLLNTNVCLKAVGNGETPTLSTDCLSQQSTWKLLSKSKLHLAAKDDNGEYLCLHMDPSGYLVTRKCICVGDDPNCKDDPTSQWFKLVSTNVK